MCQHEASGDLSRKTCQRLIALLEYPLSSRREHDVTFYRNYMYRLAESDRFE